jgi:hypothetical protein
MEQAKFPVHRLVLRVEMISLNQENPQFQTSLTQVKVAFLYSIAKEEL